MNRIGTAAVAVAAAALLLTGSCVVNGIGGEIRGSGQAKSEDRAVGAFERISLQGAAHLTVRVGTPQSVRVEADDNLLGVIVTEVNGGTLRIFSKKSYSPKTDVRVTITTPAFSGLDVGGSCTADIAGITGPHFDLAIAGAGSVKGSGTADDLTIRVSGSGSIDVENIQSKRAEVDVSGAGNVRLTATEELSAKVSGVGEVRYAGKPAKVERKVLGVGRIEPA